MVKTETDAQSGEQSREASVVAFRVVQTRED